MHQEHDFFKPPENPDQKVWRYIDTTKFLDLINSNSLFFTRTDLFEDVYEGSLTKKSVEARTKYYELLDQMTKTPTEYTPDFYNRYNQALKSEIALNCWHMSDYESAAMWKLYLKSNEGIAIQSTYSRLSSCFDETEIPVFIGKVKYIDYDNHFIDLNNLLLPFVHKRRSFEHEKELRCLVWQNARSEDAKFSLDTGGVKIEIDLEMLVENIYISPNTPAWFTILINDIVKKYNLNLSVINSRLSQLPLF